MKNWLKRLFATFTFCLVIQILIACNPEPGPQHFPQPPAPVPPQITSGYFEVHNKHTGLPTNNILSVLMHGKKVLVGSEDHGLLLFEDGNWREFNPETTIKFPAYSVSCLLKKDENTIYAGTPQGLIEIFLDPRGANPKFKLLNINSEENLNILSLSVKANSESTFIAACDKRAGKIEMGTFIPFQILDYYSPTGFSATFSNSEFSLIGCNLGLFKAIGEKLIPFDLPGVEQGWVSDIKTFDNKTIFFTSSNGAFAMEKNGKIHELLPGIWSTCLSFSGKPNLFEETPIQPRVVLSQKELQPDFESDPKFKAVVSMRDELKKDYEEYQKTYRSYRNNPLYLRQLEQEYWARFQDVFDAMENLVQERIKIEIPLSKGLWVGTQNQGLILFADDGKKYHLNYENSKLPSDSISAIDSRNSGEAWFATKNAGLLHYSRKIRNSELGLQKLLKCQPNRVRIYGSLLYIGTKSDGLHIYNSQNKRKVAHLNSIKNKNFHSEVNDFAMDANGVLWIAGDRGLISYDGSSLKNIGFNQEKLPDYPAKRVCVDSSGRICVAFSGSIPIEEQIYFFNGQGLENLDYQKLLELLQLDQESQKSYFDFFGLSNTYQREFDLINASDSVRNFSSGNNSPVTAIINLPNYLQIGSKSGAQTIFDGESFKQLSEKGSGKLGEILNFAKLPSNRLLIQGKDVISIFDGLEYNSVVIPVASTTGVMTDFSPDSQNPEAFWVSFSNGSSGGFALYQKPYWEPFKFDVPVYSLAVGEAYIFICSKDGVYYYPN